MHRLRLLPCWLPTLARAVEGCKVWKGWIMYARAMAAISGTALIGGSAVGQCGYEWRDVGFVDGDIKAMLRWDPDGPGPEASLLVIGGGFNSAAGVITRRVACFDGSTWRPMAQQLESGVVGAMTVWRGDLIIAGSFRISGLSANTELARWTGAGWEPLAEPGFNSAALAEWNGDLFAGGRGLARFVDGRWQAIVPSLGGDVTALLSTPAGLAVGGLEMQMPSAGTRFRAAIWDGVALQPLIDPNQPNGEAFALTWHLGRLYITGRGTMAQPPGFFVGVWKWESNQWTPVGDQFQAHVYSIAARDDQLFVGGVFTGTSSNACPRFARLDGDRWKAVAGSFPGSVSSQGVYSILPIENGLFVAGRRLTNSVVSMNAIAFLAISPSPDFNTDSFVDDLDFSLFALSYTTGSCGNSSMPAGCPADLNADGFVDDLDFQLFAVAYDRLICP
jgi:hypothetical protein